MQRRVDLPPQCVGLKFFNVFGPNEYHKAHMRSVIATVFDDAQAGGPVRLFKSHRAGIEDGNQQRDFIYVEDAVAVMRWLIDRSDVSGIFNVGTGTARSFRDLVTALFRALGREPNIVYFDMPEAIRDRYQYFTRANMERLRQAGYDRQFTPLEAGVADYATRFLAAADRYR
jgi:ADP-L-glycero-D-manno-heptose 6-epimerase